MSSGRYVVDENGEHVAMLLDVEEYEQLVAQHYAPAEHDESIGDEPLDDEENFDPEEGERRITEFITSANELPGPPVADLADHVAELMRAAWRDVETIMSGNPHNKVLATQLLLSQRARELRAGEPEQWRLSAATSLLGGMFSTSASGADK